MRESIVPSWSALRTSTIGAGCLTGLLAAIALGCLWMSQSAPIGVALVFAFGTGIQHVLIGLVVGWLLFRLDYLVLRLLMNLPKHGMLQQQRWRWLSFLGLVALNGGLSFVAVWAIPVLLTRLFVSVAVSPLMSVVFVGVTWYGAVEWFLPFSLPTSAQYRWHRILGVLVLLLASLTLWWATIHMRGMYLYGYTP